MQRKQVSIKETTELGRTQGRKSHTIQTSAIRSLCSNKVYSHFTIVYKNVNDHNFSSTFHGLKGGDQIQKMFNLPHIREKAISILA